MATELETSERAVSMMQSNSKKGGGESGGRDEADAAVYKQLVERVRALEESLKKMEGEEEGTASQGVAADERPIYSSTAEEMGKKGEAPCCYTFQMPMHYPRYRKADYERMPEWHLDRLLEEYGLPIHNVASTLAEKREFAIGVFLWGHQRD